MQKKIKILAITSHYPPYHVGGYEMRCKNVLDRLTYCGYEIKIIVSSDRLGKPDPHVKEANVYRKFHLLESSTSTLGRLIRDYRDMNFFHQLIKSFKPDLVYLWQVTGLTKAIFPYLADCDFPIVYDEGHSGLINSWSHEGTWYSYIESKSKSKVKNKIKNIIAKLVSKISGNILKELWKWPENMVVYFNSNLGKRNALENGIPLIDPKVIYSGVDLNFFLFRPREKMHSPIRIIVPGRLQREKGQLDAVYLLSQLSQNNLNAHLTIVGKINSVAYYHEIEDLANSLDLKSSIRIIPMVNHDELLNLYHESDICFFPSYHKTGLSRVPLEAMSCGCLVITYGNEGSDEIIVNEKTGYVVSQKDYQDILTIIQDNLSDPSAYQQTILNARKIVEKKYSIDNYTKKIELLILHAMKSKKSK